MAHCLNQNELQSALERANDTVLPVSQALAKMISNMAPSLKPTLAWNFVCHVKCHSVQDVEAPELKSLLTSAISYDVKQGDK